MGKEGYIVKLKSITLEAQNPEDTKGRRSISENGTIRIRKHRSITKMDYH